MSRFKITVAYDGTGYAGWQVQPNGTTVQEMLETVLARLDGAPVKVHGSGRTDQGVHARGQVAHFDLTKPFHPVALRRALNALLPEDIRVMRVQKAASDFHARKHAVDKEYRYFIWNAETVLPTARLYHLHEPQKLDLEAMRSAAAQLVGRHDFAAFTANPNRVVESTVRQLFELSVRKRGNEVILVARGEGFLYKMVRSVAGWLIRVGKGEVAAEATTAILESKRRTARVPTAQPHGLFLWNVRYRA
jgi:tRNA pseudouridine38-40 synthase